MYKLLFIDNLASKKQLSGRLFSKVARLAIHSRATLNLYSREVAPEVARLCMSRSREIRSKVAREWIASRATLFVKIAHKKARFVLIKRTKSAKGSRNPNPRI